MVNPTVIVVAGTGTEVGKTWVAARLATALRDRALTVAGPQAGAVLRARRSRRGHRRRAARRRDRRGPPPRCARRTAGTRWRWRRRWPPTCSAVDRLVLADLVDELGRSWGDAPADVRLVELAGGIWSPIAHDGDGLDLTAALAPDHIVLVADAGLGTINVDPTRRRRAAPIAPVDDPAQPLRPRGRAAPPQPGLAGGSRRARGGHLGRRAGRRRASRPSRSLRHQMPVQSTSWIGSVMPCSAR